MPDTRYLVVSSSRHVILQEYSFIPSMWHIDETSWKEKMYYPNRTSYFISKLNQYCNHPRDVTGYKQAKNRGYAPAGVLNCYRLFFAYI